MAEKKSIISKIKSIKNIELIVALFLCGIVILIFFSSFTQASTSKETTQQLSFSQWNEQLEARLAETLSLIDKAGKVQVMITYESGVEQVYAYQIITQTNGTTVTETKQLVTNQGKPVLLYELAPKIKGVVIVAEGAKIATVKQEIVRATQALLLIDKGKIEVFTHK